jgi:SNF2 family DNA or RNA helicase
MKDISVDFKRRQVIFWKRVWAENEIAMANAMNFLFSENGDITAQLVTTTPRALFEFIKISFRNFNEAPSEKTRREQIYSSIKSIYDTIFKEVDKQASAKIKYWDTLFQHQKEGVIIGSSKKHIFYAFDMGTGKTITSASLSLFKNSRVTLIVCPAAVKWNWLRDLRKFGFNDLNFTILDSSKTKTLKAFIEKYIIINYDILGSYSEYIIKKNPDFIIFDEAHNLKSTHSLRFKNVNNIIKNLPEANIAFLSGTPVKNRVNDVFAYLKLISHPLGENYSRFQREYLTTTNGRGGGRITGAKNLQDLYVKMSNFMIRKTKEECLDLPEKNYIHYNFLMDDYRDEYIKIVKELAKTKDTSNLHSNLNSLNIVIAKSKIKGIIELAETIINEGRKVVIFSSYKEPLAMLQSHFHHRNVKIDGSVESFDRDQLVQRFWEDDSIDVFLGNIIAAGVGINLTNATDVIFTNFPYTPAELWQAIDRLHRIGQKNNINVYFTFAEDSIDEYIYSIICNKDQDIVALVDRGRESISKENVQELLITEIKKRYGQGEENDAIPTEEGGDRELHTNN